MLDLSNKSYAVFGVANKSSICYSIVEYLCACGAEVYVSCLPDVEERVRKLLESFGEQVGIFPCDVTNEEQVEECVLGMLHRGCPIDGLVHGIAFSDREQLKGHFLELTEENFRTTMHISVYSFVKLCLLARDHLMSSSGGSIVTLTFDASQRPYPHYNVMGVAKAALESAMRYAAFDLGEHNIRVNALSASPEDTLSARGISNFRLIGRYAEGKSLLGRRATKEEIAYTTAFLLSPLATGITGQTIMVDCGSSVPEMPPPRNARTLAEAMAAVADTYEKQNSGE